MKRRSQGIEPESYVPAPEPPAPVENSGIGQPRYLGPDDRFRPNLTACLDCGVLVYNAITHDRWHDKAGAR